MALRFAELGARLFLIGRREDPLRETCEEILRFGGAAAYATCDVRDYHAVEAAAAKADQQFGEINTLVNNAAGNFIARTEKLSANALNAVLGIVQEKDPPSTLPTRALNASPERTSVPAATKPA